MFDKILWYYQIKEPLPSFYYMFREILTFFRKAFTNPENTVFTNIWVPSELLFAMRITPLNLEACASALSSIGFSDIYLEAAEEKGIANTLCGFHRLYLGAFFKDLAPTPKAALYTTHLCDGNLPSFEYVAHNANIPTITIDTPYYYNNQSFDYLVFQLKKAISQLEDIFKRKIDYDHFKKVIQLSNEAREYMKQAMQLRKTSRKLRGANALSFLFPNTQFFGDKIGVKFYKGLYRDLKNDKHPQSADNLLKILWLGLSPSYNGDLDDLVDDGKRAIIIAEEFNQVYWSPMNPDKPIESLARKIMENPLVGPLENRLKAIVKQAEDFDIDGVIHFSHWGCRQSMGNVGILSTQLNKQGIPFLNLDGDLIDPRAYTPGQFKTRVEGFFEMLEKRR